MPIHIFTYKTLHTHTYPTYHAYLYTLTHTTHPPNQKTVQPITHAPTYPLTYQPKSQQDKSSVLKRGAGDAKKDAVKEKTKEHENDVGGKKEVKIRHNSSQERLAPQSPQITPEMEVFEGKKFFGGTSGSGEFSPRFTEKEISDVKVRLVGKSRT